MEYILTIDVGTTSVKCGIFDSSLRQLKAVSAEYTLITPDGSVVEVDPEIYLQKIRECILSMRESGLETENIRYLTATTQGETMIPVDKTGEPLSNAVVWLDSRAEAEAAWLSGQFPTDLVYRTTGLPGLDGYTPIAKMRHLLKHFAGKGEEVFKFLLLEDYLIWKLTGRMVTEKTLLSSTGFFDIGKDELWNEMLEAAEVPSRLIPESLESGERAGKLLADMADYLFVSREAVMITGAMDQVCGAIGCGNIIEGRLHETTGTAMVLGASTRTPDFGNPYQVTIYRHGIAGLYLMIPICRTAAVIQKWFREQFCKEETEEAEKRGISVYDYLAELAAQAGAKEDGPILFPYFNGCMAPAAIDNARGSFFGIGLNTTKKDLIRTIPEGISFMLRENLEMLEKMGIGGHSFYSLGGPSKNEFWCQLKADITGREVIAAPELESTSFGAACLGAVAAGFFGTIEDAAASFRNYKTFRPRPEAQNLYQKKYVSYQKLVECTALFYNKENCAL